MQNKPNFQKAQMNVNACFTRNYKNQLFQTLPENKPNLPEGKTDTKSVFTKDYDEKCS
jgi:hypothetical protein